MRTAEMKFVIAPLAGLVAGLAFAGTAVAEAPSFTLQTTDRAMYGTREVDQGRFADGAQRLERMLELAGSSRSLRQPALNELCIAYTMLRDFQAAEARCQESVENGRSTGLALNNRGVMRIAAGNYEAGVQDFAAALEVGGARSVATKNLSLAQQRVAEMRTEDNAERAADNGVETDARSERDERAAVVEATAERFAQLIEDRTLELASNLAADQSS